MFEEKYMLAALKEAEKSANEYEVPVGCVIVRDGKIIARGRNSVERKKNPLCHAEIIAINKASKKLGGWRLIGCEMYVTLEPCPMCYGAIINSRIEKLYYGASDEKKGALGGAVDLSAIAFNHKPEIESGISSLESEALLKDFFKKLRERNKK